MPKNLAVSLLADEILLRLNGYVSNDIRSSDQTRSAEPIPVQSQQKFFTESLILAQDERGRRA
jgi:hypothetical protein